MTFHSPSTPQKTAVPLPFHSASSPFPLPFHWVFLPSPIPPGEWKPPWEGFPPT